MTDTNHLCHLWEHTIVKIFKHDPESELGIMFKQWIIFNKLENFYSILNYPPLMILHHLEICVTRMNMVIFCLTHQ